MSLPIIYPPMPSYFQLSIIFLTPQILQHPPHWHNLLQPVHESLLTIPYTSLHHQPSTTSETSHMTYDHIVIFSFLSLFSFTRCILLRPNRSQVVTPCDRDLTICFTTHEPCACFTYHLYLRLLYLLWKTRKFSPELRLKFILSHHFTSLHLHTFSISRTPDTLCFIAPYQTSISHCFALLDTTSGDHFTALELHPSEPHRICT